MSQSDEDIMPGELFSVFHWGLGDEQVREKYLVEFTEATESVKHLITSVAARAGFTKRVIMVDALDRTMFEWKFGEGITFPPREDGTAYGPIPAKG